jgi:hypothetical protein
MNVFFHAVRASLATGLVGVCALGGMAMARGTSGPGKMDPDPVTVYSRANILSPRVKVLNKGEVFHVQTELSDGSDRWCAITDRNNLFIGYVLCDQLKKAPKRSRLHRQAKNAAKPAERHASTPPPEPVPSKELSVPAMPEAPAIAAPMPQDKGSDATDRVAGGIVTANDGSGVSGSIAGVVFVLVFGYTVSLAYFIARYKDKIMHTASHETAAGAGSPDLSQETGRGGNDEAAVAGPVIEPVGGEQAAEVRSDVKKADSSSIGKLVKCQLCGVHQILEIDMKCINCRAVLSYYIEVKQKLE